MSRKHMPDIKRCPCCDGFASIVAKVNVISVVLEL